MHGKNAKCHVCLSQIRPADAPTDTGCRDTTATWESNTCTGFTAVTHQTLALRVAELHHYLAIAWDTILAVLDLSSKLPEVPECPSES